MSLSIFDIAKGISWTNSGHFYLNPKENKYELILDYLNSSNIKSLKNDINRLAAFQEIRSSQSKKKIEDYIINNIEGFNDRENGYSAYLAGAHDKSASIQYNIESDLVSLIHPNIPTLEKFIIQPEEIINLAYQMLQVLYLQESLKFREN